MIEQQLATEEMSHEKIIELSNIMADLIHRIEQKTERWLLLAELME
jgi:hypothetical protein